MKLDKHVIAHTHEGTCLFNDSAPAKKPKHQRRSQPPPSGGRENRWGPGAKPPKNFLGLRPLRLWETPLLKIEIRPFEHRDTPFFDKNRQMKSFVCTRNLNTGF